MHWYARVRSQDGEQFTFGVGNEVLLENRMKCYSDLLLVDAVVSINTVGKVCTLDRGDVMPRAGIVGFCGDTAAVHSGGPRDLKPRSWV